MSGAVVRKAEQLRGMRLSRGYKVIRIDEVPPESVRLTLCGRSRWYENDPAYPEPMQMSFAALVEYRNVYGSGGFEGQAFEFLREHGLVGRDAPAVPLTPADRALSYIRTQCPLCEGKGKAWLDTAGLKEILCDGCGRFFVSQELWENLCCEIRTAGDRLPIKMG